MVNALSYGIDLGQIYGRVDAIKTARHNLRTAENAIAEQEKLTAARGAGARQDPGWFENYATIAPQEAVQLRQYYDGLDEKKRTDELARAKERTEQIGRAAVYVKSAQDPAAAYGQIYANAPADLKAGMPAQYNPQYVDYWLSQTMELDDLLTRMDRGQQAAAIGSALGGGLVQSESGGNFQAQNSAMGAGGQAGHYGRGQFGHARLQDAKNAGVLPQSYTPEMFMQDPEMQAAVEQWHRGDILQKAQRNGTYAMIGQTINGVPITEQGLVNVAHLGGSGGAERFFKSGGQYDPADENGTRLSDYLGMGAREGGQQGQPQEQQQPDPRQQVATALQTLVAAGVDQGTIDLVMGQIAGKPQDLMNVSPGATIFDPQSRQPVFTAPQKPEEVFRQATPQEAAMYGAQAGQFGPDGRFYPINPPSGMSIESDGQGGFSMQQGAGVTGKPLNEGQSKNVIYATRAEGSLPLVDQYGDALTSRVDRAADAVPLGLGRGLQTGDFQRGQQAGDEFLAAILRKDTGAAITPQEMEIYGRTYLPFPGDTPELLAQKKASRARATEALRRGMTPAEILALEKPNASDTDAQLAQPQAVRTYRYNPETDGLEAVD